jgi:hypothetical protein
MCPRATARHAMARAAACASVAAASSAHSFGEEEYIDLDLSSYGEFEFRARRSSADELLCRGAAAAATHKAATTKSAAKTREVGAGGGGRRSAATVAPLQHSHSAGFFRDAPPAAAGAEGSRRRKAARTVQAKLQASRAFFRSLFARTSCSEERCRGAPVRARARATPYGDTKKGGYRKAPFGEIRNGYGSASRAAPTTLRSSIEQEKLMDEEELAARQRKSFSGVIRWRHASTTSPASAKPLSSSSARRSSNGAGPALKRSNSARSESEGLIQGAIAYCKRSQQQQLGLCPGGGGPPAWPSNPTRSAPAYYCYY